MPRTILPTDPTERRPRADVKLILPENACLFSATYECRTGLLSRTDSRTKICLTKVLGPARAVKKTSIAICIPVCSTVFAAHPYVMYSVPWKRELLLVPASPTPGSQKLCSVVI